MRTRLRIRLALLIGVLLAAGPLAAGKLTLTILYDNDLHGHLLPFAYAEVGRGGQEKPSVGGAARRATLIRKLKKQAKNPVFLINAGDCFTRGPLATTYEGIPDVEAMNAIGYQLSAIGNNEFKAKDGVDRNDADGSKAALQRLFKRSTFPWICANATDETGACLQGVQPYVIRQINGVKVGFLGLTAPRSADYPQTKGWKFTDPISAAKVWIPKARADCDLLIAVTHLGVDMDRQLASQTTGIDAIFGGDSHTFLYKALEVTNPDGAKVPIFQDGEYGVNLGKADLTFDDSDHGKWRLTTCTSELIPIGPGLAEDADVTAAIAPFLRPLEKVIANIPQIQNTPDKRMRATTQLLVDALRLESGADLALNPSGDGLFASFHRTQIRRYDVFEALPYKDYAVVATMTDADVKKMLKGSPQMVISGEIGKYSDTDSIKVALVDYFAASNLPNTTVTNTDKDIRELLIAWLQSKYPAH